MFFNNGIAISPTRIDLLVSAPVAPSDLVATADGGYSRVNLTWTDNSDNEDNFELQYDTDIGFGSPTTVEPLADSEWHQVSGLTRGSTYYFRIRAVNTGGNSAWSATANATVFAISDIALYADYDANADVYTDAGVTLATDGQTVQEIHDQTGNGRHITQTTAGAKPALETNELNGLPVIRHASGDILVAATAADWKFLNDDSNFLVYVVYKITSANPNLLNVLLDTGAISSGDIGFSLLFDDRSSVPREEVIAAWIAKGSVGNYVNAATTPNDAVAAGEWHIASARRSGNNTLQAWNDGFWGANVGSTEINAPVNANPTAPLTVGGRRDNTFNHIGDWARILMVANSDTYADHQKIMQYLAEEYALFEIKEFAAAAVVQTNASDPNHNAFPGLCISPNGNLVMAYNKGSTHISADGDLIVRISTDGGTTWGSESIVWDFSVAGGGTTTWGGPSLTTLSDGRVVMAVGSRVSGAPVNDGLGYFESSDNGATWTGPTAITASGYTDFDVGEGGGIIELANGNLLFPYYGQDSGDTKYSAAYVVSTDGGDTWGGFKEVADGPADGRSYAEPGIVQLGNGDLLMLIRVVDTVDETNDSIYKSTSTDGGATWSAPVQIMTASGGRQTPFLMATGEIIVPIRDTKEGSSPYRCAILFSADSGASWQVGQRFVNSPNFTNKRMTYGQFAQGNDGTIYLVYATEATGSPSSRSDIMFVKTKVTE